MGRDPIRAGTPSGLLSLAAMVRRHMPHTEIHLVDALVEGSGKSEIKPGVFRYGLTRQQLIECLAEIKLDSGDVVAISNLHTSEWKNAALCAEVAKETSANVVLGGHHPTYQPEFMLNNTMADYVVLGEGEYPFLELLKAITENRTSEHELGRIRGIAFKASGGEIIKTGRGASAAELDELENPALDLLKPELYNASFSHWGEVAKGTSSIIDYACSRGCPMGCTFCTSTELWGKKIRTFSPARVKGQLRRIRDMGFDNLSIEDDQVLLLPKAVKEAMFTELGKLGINWVIDAGIYYPKITEEFASLIADSGCYRVFLPIEHPVLEIMHEESKYLGLKSQGGVKEKLANVFNILGRAGIEFYVAMMVGFRHETQETLDIVKEYAAFAMEHGAAWISFFFAKPLPGTTDYKDYSFVPQELMWENAPEYWTLSMPIIKPEKLEIDGLYRIVNEISEYVNGRPNTLVDPFAKKKGEDDG